MALATSPIAELVDQLRVPGGWEVCVGERIAAGWLGAIHVPLAVMAPGPGGPGAHRTQLVVFVGSNLGAAPALDLASDPAPDPVVRAAPAAGTGDDGLAWAAAAAIPEAWRIDEVRGWTEVFRAPWDGRYRSRTLCLPGEAIVPLALTRLRVTPLRRPCAR